MGRYDFRAARVHATAQTLLESGRMKTKPRWLGAVAASPVPEILVRTTPVQHTGYGKTKPGRKVSVFRPQNIEYPEDKMRKTFFRDHPWELARPRLVLEGSRLDGGETWDTVRPESLSLQPENVIRRQLWLIEHEGKDPQTAYDIARREFYRQRLREDVERKVAKEEALHVGAYFDKSTIAWGMKLEDRKFHGFKRWAAAKLLQAETRRQNAITDTGAGVGLDEAEELVDEAGLVEGAESVGDSGAPTASTIARGRRGSAPPALNDATRASLRV